MAAPRHNPKAREEYLPETLTLAANPSPSPNREPWPGPRLTSAAAGPYRRPMRGAAATPTVVVPRPPGGGETGRCALPEPLALATLTLTLTLILTLTRPNPNPNQT